MKQLTIDPTTLANEMGVKLNRRKKGKDSVLDIIMREEEEETFEEEYPDEE